MKKIRFVYLWVIRSDKKVDHWLWQDKKSYEYFANRTAIKNPRYKTQFTGHVKLFRSKADAENFYFLKTRRGFDVSDFSVRRLKFWIGRNGYLDYFRMSKTLQG